MLVQTEICWIGIYTKDPLLKFAKFAESELNIPQPKACFVALVSLVHGSDNFLYCPECLCQAAIGQLYHPAFQLAR